MKQLVIAACALAFVLPTSPARADDKANPIGTWKWTMGAGGKTREATLTLKLEGDKLTGSMPGHKGKEITIEGGSYKNGEVSFKVTREHKGKKSTSTYIGKVSGDTIKGKVEFERDGQTKSRDWEAKRTNG